MQRKNLIDYILPVAYGLCVFLFFWKLFPYHLPFQEQFQLFLFTKNYFLETCSHPGGFCNYAGRFLTQFFLFPFVGAMIISCLLTGIQQLVYAIIRRISKHSAGLFLSFLPSLFYWYLLCDESYRAGGIIALLIALTVTLAGTFFKSQSVRRIYLFACIPVLYWLAGGVVILFIILLSMYEWRHCKDVARRVSIINFRHVFTIIAAVCFAFSLPFIAKYFLAQYPLYRYLWGVDYVRFIAHSPVMIAYLWILIFIVVAGVSFLPNRKPNKIKFAHSVIQSLSYSVILFLAIYFVIVKYAYPKYLYQEEIMAYDYHCRMKNWDKMIELADRKSPTEPMAISCLNLALYKTGQLPDKMFHYFQAGPEGLLRNFQRDYILPMIGTEPYYYLGFVNSAQRFITDAMSAIPDGQKSVRIFQRLSETNLINGYYEVASKYLHHLENTLFYRNWAKNTRSFLYDEAKIDAHPEWGEIRRFQIDIDFIYKENEKSMMLLKFFQHRPDNRMAYEYLMAYTLLTKDIRNFPHYFQLEKDFTYQETPKSWQEALVFIKEVSNNNMDTISYPISKPVMQEFAAYANIYTTFQSPEPALRKQFSKTYWYYLHFINFNRTNTESMLQY